MNAMKIALVGLLSSLSSISLWAGTVGGKITGIKGSYAVLKNNNTNSLILISNAGFKFTALIAKGKPYKVTVTKHPLNQTCIVTNGAGTMGSLNVGNIVVTCTTNKRSVGGAAIGLKGTLQLRLNSNLPMSLSSSTGATKRFTFPTAQTVEQGKSYLVSVVSSPTGYQCTPSQNQGLAGASNITSVAVTCSLKKHSVSGLISGLPEGQDIKLKNNGGDEITISGTSSEIAAFTFPTTIAQGGDYNVSVSSAPEGITCTANNAIGELTAPVNNIVVICSSQTFAIGGTISGLSTAGLILKNGNHFLLIDPPNPGDTVNYSFPSIAYNGSYNITVDENPVGGAVCSIDEGVGANIKTQPMDINVVCGIPRTVGGNYSGVTTSGLVLQNNSGDNVSIDASESPGEGSFVFSQSVVTGSHYKATVFKHPALKFCKFNSESPYDPSSGTVVDNISNLRLECVDTNLKCWGMNNVGQLGDGTTVSRSVPVSVTGLDTAVNVSQGVHHVCTLSQDGTVECWGGNGKGQLGNNTTTSSTAPTPVVMADGEELNNVTAISSGTFHTCALMVDKTVQCWGDNAFGQLGDETTTDRLTPVPVNSLSNVESIAAGGDHTCALLGDDTVKCWGNNGFGQLGDGTTTNSSTPVTALGNAAAISAGANYNCALLNDGSAKCWGLNSGGQLGDGTNTNQSVPTAVSGLNNATVIKSGVNHTCAITSEGAINCWGDNLLGQLGDGTTNNSTVPVTVISLISPAKALSLGAQHTCATFVGETVKCWGNNSVGQLGSPGDSSATPLTVDLAGNKSAIAAVFTAPACCKETKFCKG